MSSTSGQLSHYGSIYSATASSMQPPTPSAPPGLASSPPVRLAQPQPTRLPQSSTEARVVVLLDGEQVQLSRHFSSSGPLGGPLASLQLHDQVLRFAAAREGRAARALVLLFGDQQGLLTELGEEKGSSFIRSFNSTEGFASAYIDVGDGKGAGISAICSHLTFHALGCDYLILGLGGDMTSAGRDKLLSVLEHLQRNPSTQVLILDLGVESRLWAARLGVEMANFGEVLEAKSARLKATPRQGPHPNESLLMQASPESEVDFPAWPAAPASQPEPDPEPCDSRSFAAVMKTRPTAFAKPKPPKPKPIILPRPPSPSHPISPTSSTSHRKIPESLKPLLKVLREQAALGSDRPLCSHVGGELGKQFKGRFYLEKAGSFKRYVGQAEEGGWVRLGKGEKLGSEWIALV